MRHVLATFALACAASSVVAQQAASTLQSRPASRWPDGRISFTGTAAEPGNWEGPANGTIFYNVVDGKVVRPPSSLPGNLLVDQVPFKPWARKVYDHRQATLTAEDPHTRCKPSGGPRMFHTPYGTEILDLRDTQEVIILSVGSPHSWRHIPTDGRALPARPTPTWYGHSSGRWEGDVLVIDTVGFNERFWLTREGVPHTRQVKLHERISRPNYGQLRYEAVIDDPGTYTATWGGGWHMRWSAGNEPFDYLCQENNRDPARMVGPQEAVAEDEGD